MANSRFWHPAGGPRGRAWLGPALAGAALLAGLPACDSPQQRGEATTTAATAADHSTSSSMPASTTKFKLRAGPCAADGYFVTIHGGEFSAPDGSSFPVPSGATLEGNWGASGTIWGVGDEQQPAPSRLALSWFAYAENKFYEGDFELPHDRLLALLQQGTWDVAKQQPAPYNELVVCVIPKGGVVVWLAGGNQVLLGRFQGHEVFPSAATFQHYYGSANRAILVQETQEEMPAEVQQQIAAGTVSAQKWENYLQTYPWRVAFNVPFQLATYGFYGVDAARISNPDMRDLAPYHRFLLEASPKPAPRKLYVRGQAEHGANYEVRVRQFDEAETAAAFRTLRQASPDSPLTLLIAIDKPYRQATLVLQNDHQQVPLTKTKVELSQQ